MFRARCCNPIRGERIVGYITRGKGVSVHSASCTNVVSLLYDPERRIDVEWDRGEESEASFTVRLTVKVEDRKGILADVSAKVAGINTNIKTMEATTDEREGRIEMTVEINDVKHLEKVLKSLRAVDGVLNVERASRCERRRGCRLPPTGVDSDARVGSPDRGAGASRCGSRGRQPAARSFGTGWNAGAYPRCAIASISTRTSRGSLATCTVARAGAGASK